jgi:DNA-binding MarR family transcriptional regulator
MKRDAEKNTASAAGTAGDTKEWPHEVLKRFRLIFRAVQQHSQWVETRCGVTSAQLWALWELSESPGLRVSDMARAMSIHHSTASNLLDKLARKGLIKRERVSEDQRVVTLNLTREGIDLIERAPSPARGILQHALFRLPKALLQSLAQDLEVLVKEMAILDDEVAMQPLNPLAKTRRRVKKTHDPAK